MLDPTEFRIVDGLDDHQPQTTLNSTGATLTRIGEARFADGISALSEGPNPRTISNIVVGDGDPTIPNPDGLSGMIYAWGQFVDHDLTRIPSDGATHIDIEVPPGDVVFPSGSVISMTRAVIDPASGQGTQHPATAINSVTGWHDASMVYGSDAASLRKPDGHMKTSAGDNLPIVNGAFAAGDVRAAENPSLTALQTLFVREHNYQVGQLSEADPGLSRDEPYNQARAIVTAEIQHITYHELLPLLLGSDALSAYKGFDSAADPRITLEFAGAAFRFGHSMVSAETERLGEDGQILGKAHELRDVFFMPPAEFAADSGADGFLRHFPQTCRRPWMFALSRIYAIS